MKRFTTSISTFKRRITFGKREPKPNSNSLKPNEEPKKSQKENSLNLSNISDDNIQKSSELIEDIIFIHSYYGVKRLQKPNKKSHQINMTYIDYDDISQDLVLDEKEMEGIKTEQILNILRPKIEKYLTYNDLEFNCTFMLNLYSYAEEIGFDNTVGCLFPLIQELTFKKDIKDKIIFSFFSGLDNFLKFLIKYDTNHEIILNKILPVFDQILNNKKDKKMIEKAIEALKKVTTIMTPEEIRGNLIPFILNLYNNENNLTAKKLSFRLFNDFAKILGNELIESYVIPQLESITENTNVEIRRCCINNILNIYENVSYNVLKTKMVRIFQTFSSDESVEIRQKCCELLPSICKISRSELVSQYLLPIYILYSNDVDESLRNCALGIFGELVFYLQKEDIKLHTELLKFYINQIQSLYESKKIMYLTTLYKCAFSFPSVLLAYYRKVSPKKWNVLKTIYLKFINDKDIKIQKTIANSFGEIAKILDPEISENEIGPLILSMYNQDNKEIKEIIISILPEYLYSINDKKKKIQFLGIYKDSAKKLLISKTWREKINFLKSIARLNNIYDHETMFSEVFLMCIHLCFDAVNKVRIKSAKVLSKLIFQFFNSEDEQYKIKSIVIIRIFATCLHYHYRQLFIFMCKKLIEEESTFMELIFELIENLSYDKIVNVRITLGRFFQKIWMKKQAQFNWIKTNKKILEIIYRLKNDETKDVTNTLEEINIEDVKKGLNYQDYSEILVKKDVNVEFTNKFEEMKTLLGFSPAIFNNSKIKK